MHCSYVYAKKSTCTCSIGVTSARECGSGPQQGTPIAHLLDGDGVLKVRIENLNPDGATDKLQKHILLSAILDVFRSDVNSNRTIGLLRNTDVPHE